MAKLVPLQQSYGKGIVRDVARHQLPPGALWDCRDCLPDIIQEPLAKRGGFTFASPALGGSYGAGTFYAPYLAGGQLLGITDTGRLIRVDSPVSATDVGAAYVMKQPPVFFENQTILLDPAAAAAPKTYDGTAVTALSSAPTGSFATAYKDRLLIAKGNKLYNSALADTATWNLTTDWMSLTQGNITGLASLRNAVLIFTSRSTTRVRGLPLFSDKANFVVDEGMFEVGCPDARSIISINEKVIWANQTGIWMTDGAYPEELTRSAGLRQYWKSLLVGYNPATWSLVGGSGFGFYFITIMNGSTVVDTLMFDMEKRDGVRLSNIDATGFARALGGSEELYFSRRGSSRLVALSSIFLPTSANKNDADGVVIQPYFETGFFRPGPGLHNWLSAYLGYDLRDAASDAPTITFKAKAFTDAAWRTLGSFGATTKYQRKYKHLRFAQEAVAFRVEQVGPSASTSFLDIEGEMYGMEGSR